MLFILVVAVLGCQISYVIYLLQYLPHTFHTYPIPDLHHSYRIPTAYLPIPTKTNPYLPYTKPTLRYAFAKVRYLKKIARLTARVFMPTFTTLCIKRDSSESILEADLSVFLYLRIQTDFLV